MKVLCISGKAEHGKDTLAEILKGKLESKHQRVLVAHYGDLVKYVCRTFFNWNGEKDVEGRALLQKVGTDVVRKKCPDYWVKFIADMLKFFPNEWDYVLIPDCRFPNEIDILKDEGLDVCHMRVYRINYKSRLTPEQLNHISETALDNVKPDILILNNGTIKDLEESVSIHVNRWHIGN